MNIPSLFLSSLAVVATALATAVAASSDASKTVKPNVKLWQWEKGIAVESLLQENMTVYLWFYEWNMFDARQKGQHTSGSYKWKRTSSKDGRTITIEAPDMTLTVRAVTDGAEMTLKITNRTQHDWPEIAGIIPCFNPGAPKGRTERFSLAKLNSQFDNGRTWFVGKSGLQKLARREIHFNSRLRKQVARAASNGRYVFSTKWPTSNDDAHEGLLLRRSTDGHWVTGIAWNDFLSAQGHNPWQCMHLGINVGPLKVGKSKSIHGRIYLFQGSRQDCFTRYRQDFSGTELQRKPTPKAPKMLTLRATPANEGASQRQSHTIKVAGIVAKWVRGQKETNFRRVEPLIREAAKNGAKIVCTTECFLDGYAIADKSIPLDEYRGLGEKIPGGKYFERLRSLAKELRIELVAGMLEADGDAQYNTAVFIDQDGQLVGKYRKQKLGHEAVRNTPGKKSSVFATRHGNVGVMICADRRYPDVVRRFCDNGAELLICPSGGMFGSKKNDPILQARSRENRRHIVFVHPAEFLVTAPDGSIAARTILGDRLLVSSKEVGGKVDQNRVFYFDVPLKRRAAD